MTKNERPRRSAPQRAILEAVTPDVVLGGARLWGERGPAPVRIPAVQNFVYAVEREGGRAILRLTHESHRSVAEVAAEISWLIDLKQRGLPVPAVYRSLRDELVERIESDHGQFVVTCVECLAGVEPQPGQKSCWSDQMFEQLGAVMARLHQASYDAALNPAILARRGWREESVAQNFHLYVPVGEKAVHEAFDRVLAKLDVLPRSRDSFGLIHADLNPANFFLTPAGLNIFDFDDSCYCWFAYDLLVPIFHFPSANQEVMNTQAQQALHSLVCGYQTVRRFNPAWLELLPLLFKWRDLLTYGFFYEQLEIDELPERMRQTFLAMRARIESDRPIAEIGDAR